MAMEAAFPIILNLDLKQILLHRRVHVLHKLNTINMRYHMTKIGDLCRKKSIRKVLVTDNFDLSFEYYIPISA